MSKEYKIGDKNLELYLVGELSLSLGKSPITIRRWESLGILPPAKFRDKSGKRLYTKYQIDKLKILVASVKIKQGVYFMKTKFKEEAKKIWVNEPKEDSNGGKVEVKETDGGKV